MTLSIRCDAVAGRAEHIPEDGVILAPVTLPLGEGDSVYTLLTDAARKYRIQVENDGGLLPYVSGIAYLYEFDYGELSGWTYFVNGEQFLMSAGEYKPRSGDVIEWRYTTDLGEFSK